MLEQILGYSKGNLRETLEGIMEKKNGGEILKRCWNRLWEICKEILGNTGTNSEKYEGHAGLDSGIFWGKKWRKTGTESKKS